MGNVMRYIVFDTEIETMVEDCPNSWAGAKRGECGLSALVLYDSETQRYHIYDRGTIEAGIKHLEMADLVVGYNSNGFDLPLLSGIYKKTWSCPESCDILEEIWDAVGKKQKGWKLTEVTKRTLNIEKSGSGEFAPKLFQEGRFAELFDYCMNDVHITRLLFEFIVKEGYVIDPEGNRFYLDFGYNAHDGEGDSPAGN